MRPMTRPETISAPGATGEFATLIRAQRAQLGRPTFVVLRFTKRIHNVKEVTFLAPLLGETLVRRPPNIHTLSPGDVVDLRDLVRYGDFPLLPVGRLRHKEWCLVPFAQFVEHAYCLDEADDMLADGLRESVVAQDVRDLLIHVFRAGVGYAEPVPIE